MARRRGNYNTHATVILPDQMTQCLISGGGPAPNKSTLNSFAIALVDSNFERTKRTKSLADIDSYDSMFTYFNQDLGLKLV
jgi:hypothetical protein